MFKTRTVKASRHEATVLSLDSLSLSPHELGDDIFPEISSSMGLIIGFENPIWLVAAAVHCFNSKAMLGPSWAAINHGDKIIVFSSNTKKGPRLGQELTIQKELP